MFGDAHTLSHTHTHLLREGRSLMLPGLLSGHKHEDSLLVSLDGQNRQSPIASVQRTQSTLASHSAIPRGTNVERVNANRAIRIAAQQTQGL